MKTIRTNKKLFVKSAYNLFMYREMRKNETNFIISGHTHKYDNSENPVKNTGTFGYNAERINIDGLCCISDLHIGASDIDYTKFEENFKEIFETKKYKKIIIIGDLFDLWLCDPKEITNLYKDYFVRLEAASKEKTIYWVVGNHDYEYWKYWEIVKYTRFMNIYQDKLFLTIHGVKYEFLHGHQFDLTESCFIKRLFYAVWLSFGDNLHFIGNRLKSLAVSVEKALERVGL